VDRGQKDFASKGPKGTDRLAEGKPWEGNRRDSVDQLSRHQ